MRTNEPTTRLNDECKLGCAERGQYDSLRTVLGRLSGFGLAVVLTFGLVDNGFAAGGSTELNEEPTEYLDDDDLPARAKPLVEIGEIIIIKILCGLLVQLS